jgi:hypothetical protein
MNNSLTHIPLVRLTTESGHSLTVELEAVETRDQAVLYVNGVPHFLERMPKQELLAQYVVDTDPDYTPKADAAGYCFMLVPFSA